MARIRTIKPEFWTDGDLLRISRDARLFYIGLWNFSDDNGVLEYDPMGLKAKIFPIDEVNIEKLVSELSSISKVIIYEVENKKYLYLKNLSNHQIIDRPRKSHLPLPNGNQLKSTEISPIRKEGKEGSRFDEFWQIYPRQIGRAVALEIYRATIKTDKDFEDLMSALKNYKTSDEYKANKIMNCSTWIQDWRAWLNMPKKEARRITA